MLFFVYFPGKDCFRVLSQYDKEKLFQTQGYFAVSLSVGQEYALLLYERCRSIMPHKFC